MGNRRWRVRSFVGNSDRLVVLSDDGSPTHDRGASDYDDYIRKTPAAPQPMGLVPPKAPSSPWEKRTCGTCGRKVRYNLIRDYSTPIRGPRRRRTAPSRGVHSSNRVAWGFYSQKVAMPPG
jgi:hypothetical protein